MHRIIIKPSTEQIFLFNFQYLLDRRQTITPIHGEWSNLQTNKITPKWNKLEPKWKVHSQEEPIRSDPEFVCALVVNYLDDYCASLSQRWFSFCYNNHVSFDLHALFVHIISKQSFQMYQRLHIWSLLTIGIFFL